MTNPHPTSIGKKRTGLRAFAFGLVFLGVCVFAWGLRYKLSLYDPPHSIAHRVPEAKLLSGRERSTAVAPVLRQAAGLDAALAAGSLVIAFFVLLRSRLWRGSAGWNLPLLPAPALSGRRRPTPQFVRPPPRVG